MKCFQTISRNLNWIYTGVPLPFSSLHTSTIPCPSKGTSSYSYMTLYCVMFRFLLISKYLHFNNNEKRPQHCKDRLFKIPPILDYVGDRFKWVWLHWSKAHYSKETFVHATVVQGDSLSKEKKSNISPRRHIY